MAVRTAQHEVTVQAAAFNTAPEAQVQAIATAAPAAVGTEAAALLAPAPAANAESAGITAATPEPAPAVAVATPAPEPVIEERHQPGPRRCCAPRALPSRVSLLTKPKPSPLAAGWGQTAQ